MKNTNQFDGWRGLNDISCASTPDFFQRLNKSFIIVYTHKERIATKGKSSKSFFLLLFLHRAKKEEMVDTSFRLLFLLLLSFIYIKRKKKKKPARVDVFIAPHLMNCRWNRTAQPEQKRKKKKDEGYTIEWERKRIDSPLSLLLPQFVPVSSLPDNV